MVFAAQKRRLHLKRDNPTFITAVNHTALGPQINGDLSEQNRNELARRAASTAVLVKTRRAFVPTVAQHRVAYFKQRLSRMGSRRD